MTTIYTIHRIDTEKLAGVMEEMKTLGAPTIRVVDCADHWMAVEGCHRIEAANRLGLEVDWDVLAQDEIVAADSLDLGHLPAGEEYEAGELAYECHHSGNGVYRLTGGLLETVMEAES